VKLGDVPGAHVDRCALSDRVLLGDDEIGLAGEQIAGHGSFLPVVVLAAPGGIGGSGGR
jgi:hypothetical protein